MKLFLYIYFFSRAQNSRFSEFKNPFNVSPIILSYYSASYCRVPKYTKYSCFDYIRCRLRALTNYMKTNNRMFLLSGYCLQEQLEKIKNLDFIPLEMQY